jgi:hypothetical protein
VKAADRIESVTLPPPEGNQAVGDVGGRGDEVAKWIWVGSHRDGGGNGILGGVDDLYTV